MVAEENNLCPVNTLDTTNFDSYIWPKCYKPINIFPVNKIRRISSFIHKDIFRHHFASLSILPPNPLSHTYTHTNTLDLGIKSKPDRDPSSVVHYLQKVAQQMRILETYLYRETQPTAIHEYCEI